jgi:hypothetical protein
MFLEKHPPAGGRLFPSFETPFIFNQFLPNPEFSRMLCFLLIVIVHHPVLVFIGLVIEQSHNETDQKNTH